MIRFEAEKYLDIIRILTEADHMFKAIGDIENASIPAEAREGFVNVVARGVRERTEQIRLTTLVEFVKRAERAIKDSTATGGQLKYYMHAMCEVLIAEVTQQVFLQIEPEKKELYLKPDSGIGTLAEFYPQAKLHLLEANLCYSLERYTACVHHLMLATELAMRKWAKRLKLKTKVPLELEDMEAILREADAKLKLLKYQPRSAKRDRASKYLAETSAHFGFIKDAWRKHSAHGRETYDERKAKTLLNHVDAFMRMFVRQSKPSGVS